MEPSDSVIAAATFYTFGRPADEECEVKGVSREAEMP